MEQALVWMIKNDRRLSEPEWEYQLHQLPGYLQRKTIQYHQWEDRQASLFGKLLLIKGLAALGEDPALIDTMQWDQFQKPALAGGIAFNISHTAGLVVCTLSKSEQTGIDVEAIKPIDISDYKRVFTEQEYQLIVRDPYPLSVFFYYWTRKEAVMKADGRGFHLDPKTFAAISDQVEIAGHQWLIKKVSVPANYACHLALPVDKPVAVQWLTI